MNQFVRIRPDTASLLGSDRSSWQSLASKPNIRMTNLIYFGLLLISYAANKPFPNDIEKQAPKNLDSVVVKYEGGKQLIQQLIIKYTDSVGALSEYKMEPDSEIKIPLPNKAIFTFENATTMPASALVAGGDSLSVKVEDNRVLVRKPNTSQWYLSNSFDEFYNNHYPNINLKIDCTFNALYTKQFLQDHRSFTLVLNKHLSAKRQSFLFDQMLELQWIKYSTQLAALDSLRSSGNIDDSYLDWMTVRQKVNALALSIDVLRRTGRMEQVQSLFDKYQFINDRNVFAFFPEYRSFLELKYVPLVISRLKGYSSVDVFGDAKYVYDSSVKYVNGLTLDLVRFISIKHIKQNEPVNVQKDYFEKFYSDVSNTAFIDYVKGNINFEEVNGSGNSVITGDTKESLSWEHILAQHKGRLVYIDFWASWCVPCRKAMPASEKLRKDYRSKPVSFVYLSIDGDFDNWRKANQSEHLDNQLSYLLVHGNQSQLARLLKMEAIPRYLLIDKYGQIIHYNAPPPGSSEIRKLIDQVLVN